jgi:hypothetical protein
MKAISNINVLINAYGIVDSGGVTVLEKLLNELSSSASFHCHIVCSKGSNLEYLINRYLTFSNLHFITVSNPSLLYRLYFENIFFRKIISKEGIQLIYNFSGSSQFLMPVPQLVKIQNLAFYSKKLDLLYWSKGYFFLWIRDVFFKRSVFRFMLNRSKNIEIQSSHVKSYLLDFIDTREKSFYVKSDIKISNNVFHAPKHFDFSNKIKFLFIVGPHFESMHKNLVDFTNAMLLMNDKYIDFEINITLTNEQLHNSKFWDTSLNSRTNFLGYIDNQQKMTELFCDNTILISTSVIETLGLHVIEGIKNGIITIAPDEKYANKVYGNNMFKYELFNKDSLVKAIMSVVNFKESYSEKVLSIQDDLKQSEINKFSSILDIFDEVINVQK